MAKLAVLEKRAGESPRGFESLPHRQAELGNWGAQRHATLSIALSVTPPKMFYVYILISEKDGRLYVGYTNDLRKRFKKHNRGFVKATKNRRPLELIYYEAYQERGDAKRRELYLKGGNGREVLKIQLADTFKKINYAYR